MFYAIESKWLVGHGAHNIIVDILSASGVIGLLVYTFYFSKCIRLFLKSASYHLDVLVPLGMLICILAMGVGENVIRAKMVWLCIGFGFAAINGDKREAAINGDKREAAINGDKKEMVSEYDKQ